MKFSYKTVAVIFFVLAAGYYFYDSMKNKTPFEQMKPAVGDMAPEIALSDSSGKMVSLQDFKGKVVLVNFWASWCPPCKAEMPGFQKIFEAYEDKGFAVIGVAIDDITPSLIKELGITFPVVKTNERVTAAYGNVKDVPVSFLIGRDGRIVKKIKKFYSEGDLKNDVDNAMKKQYSKTCLPFISKTDFALRTPGRCAGRA